MQTQNHFPRLKVQYEILGHKKFDPKILGESIADVEVTIRDQAGNIRRQFKRPFKSFVSNFARILQYAFLAVDNSTAGLTINKLKTTGGGNPTAASVHTMAVNEALVTANATYHGIWIGDIDDEAGYGYGAMSGIGGNIDYDDWYLRGKIPFNDEDSPVSDMEFRAVSVALSDSDQTLTITRRFQNNHATFEPQITEHGLIGKSGTDYILLARDIDEGSTDLVLANGEIWEAQYVFTITNASGFTKNLLRMLSSEFIGGNCLSQVRNLDNVVQTINFSSARTQKDLLAGATIATYGILVSGKTFYDITTPIAALSTNSVNLGGEDKIANLPLTIGAVMPVALEQIGGYTTFGLYRDFENSADYSIKIQDSGLVIRQGTSPYTYYLIARDLVTTSSEVSYVELAKGQILRVKYLFMFPTTSLSIPAPPISI